MGGGRAEPTPGGQGVSPCRGAALGGGRDAWGEVSRASARLHPLFDPPLGGLLFPVRSQKLVKQSADSLIQ